MISSSCIYVGANGIIAFKWLNSVPLYVFIYRYMYIYLLYSSVSGHLGCLHVLAIVNSAPLCPYTHIGMCVSCWIRVLSAFMPRSGISGSHGNSIFRFLRICHTILHSGCNLHSLQGRRVPFSLHLPQCLLSGDFLMLAILTGMRLFLTIVSICFSLIISNVEHLFMYLLGIFGEMPI